MQNKNRGTVFTIAFVCFVSFVRCLFGNLEVTTVIYSIDKQKTTVIKTHYYFTLELVTTLIFYYIVLSIVSKSDTTKSYPGYKFND